ncbi:unnamed protein product [Gadus morhua 'NCC']
MRSVLLSSLLCATLCAALHCSPLLSSPLFSTSPGYPLSLSISLSLSHSLALSILSTSIAPPLRYSSGSSIAHCCAAPLLCLLLHPFSCFWETRGLSPSSVSATPGRAPRSRFEGRWNPMVARGAPRPTVGAQTLWIFLRADAVEERVGSRRVRGVGGELRAAQV